ncbi:MAG: carboxypeptidase-like regulatory domain-containing protein [Deltaproteobacteria bacterium]|nr:carboxypeptidase-like regulatory domain-containing protein [Deltaproteobacteria bacterium]
MKRFAPWFVVVLAAFAWWMTLSERPASADTTTAATAPRPRVRAALLPNSDHGTSAAGAIADPRGELWLEGQVVDAHGDGVAGAWIHIDARPPVILTADDSGLFEVEGLLPMRYRISARDGAQVARAVTVDLGPQTEPVQLQLAPASRVRISVVDLTLETPVAQARVEIVDVPGADSPTNAQGLATIAGIGGGQHYVRVSHPEFATAVLPLVLTDQARSLDLSVALDRGGAVDGMVVAPDGSAVPDATVRVLAPGFEAQSAWLPAATTDQDGRFSFPAITSGRYAFTASAHGYADESSAVVSVTTGGRVELPAIELSSGQTLDGQVLDENEQGVGGALVRVALAGAGLSASRQWQVYSDAAGRFSVQGLPPQAIEVVAMHGVQRSESIALDLAGDSPPAEIELALVVDGVIAGAVVDTEGEPVASARVVAIPAIEGRRGSIASYRLAGDLEAIADAQGQFEFSALRPGRYVLRASPPGRSRDAALQQAGQAEVTGTRDARLVTSGGGTIRGVVVDEDGVAVRSLRVRVDTAVARVKATPGGQFVADVDAAGLHMLTLEAPGLTSHTIEDLQLGEGDDLDLGTVTMLAGASVDGVVVDDQGRPIAGARVVAGFQIVGRGTSVGHPITVGGDLGLAQVTTDTSGRFSLTGLDGSAGAIAAEHQAYGRSAAVPRSAAGQGPLTLVLEPTGSVTGQVLRGGEPVTGATVEAVGSSSARARILAETDSRGRFSFEALAAGSWTVHAKVSRRATSAHVTSESVTVASGATARLDIDMAGGDATVEVRLGPGHTGVSFAQVHLVPGSIDSTRAGELDDTLAGLTGSAYSDILVGRAPVVFEQVSAGAWSVCVTLVSTDPEDPRQVRALQLRAATLPTQCQALNVAKGTHTVSI